VLPGVSGQTLIQFQEAMKREKSPVDFFEMEYARKFGSDNERLDESSDEEPLNKKARTICPFTNAVKGYFEHYHDCPESVEQHPFRRPVFQALEEEAQSLTIPYKAETGMYQFECK
jgi:hypothetical protein